MTVKEIIEQLRLLPQDMRVFIWSNYDGAYLNNIVAYQKLIRIEEDNLVKNIEAVVIEEDCS